MQEEIEILRVAATSMTAAATEGKKNPPDHAPFLRSWADMLKARSDWMEQQLRFGYIAPDDLVRLSIMEIEAAHAWMDESLVPA